MESRRKTKESRWAKDFYGTYTKMANYYHLPRERSKIQTDWHWSFQKGPKSNPSRHLRALKIFTKGQVENFSPGLIFYFEDKNLIKLRKFI